MKTGQSIASTLAVPLALLSLLVQVARADEARAAELIATDTRPSLIAGYADTVVFSDYRPREKRFRLTMWRAGRASTLPVVGRRAPFDVDAGPGRQGHLTLVYSRCRREGPISPYTNVPVYGLGSGCRLHAYDTVTRSERSLPWTHRPGWSAYLPTIWRGRVSFAVARRTGRASLWTSSGPGRALQPLPGGPVGVPDPTDSLTRDRGEQTLGPGPTRLDQRGSRLVVNWTHSPRRCGQAPSDRESHHLDAHQGPVDDDPDAGSGP